LKVEQLAVQQIAETLKLKPNANLMLATGSTMDSVYALLREANLDFATAKTFNLDEYHPGNQFRNFMNEKLFDHINIAQQNIHFPCDNYDQIIEESGGIDLCILGIGVNGHIAFNEPGSTSDSRTRIVELDESTRVRNSKLSDGAQIPSHAISVGIATILDCKRIIVIAKGDEKTAAVNDARNGAISSACPASFLQQHPDVIWLID
jgi:glucosamine-6-phosphate deaminase